MKTDTEAERIWMNCVDTIRSQVSDAVWRTTFSGARATAFDQRSLVLQVPTSLQKARIERRYLNLLSEAVDETKPDVTVRIEVDPTATKTKPSPTAHTSPAQPILEPHTRQDASESTSEAISETAYSTPHTTDANPEIESRFTFEHFVTGQSNRFSHAAALAVAEAPAGAYNPLFIYGGSGLGKTHLLRAIAHYISSHYPSHKIRYITCEAFLNDFVQAIRDRTQPEFKRIYRSNDVLLVDDIQFIEGKDGLQGEFFHTFNDLHQNGAQLVLSSDRAPDAMPTLENRLRSRFKSGLITDIQPPDLVTRLAILEKKAEVLALTIPPSVLSFIAENIRDSIRELEGALIKVTAYANISGQLCSHALAQHVLADLISQSAKAPITAGAIITAAAESPASPWTKSSGAAAAGPWWTPARWPCT